jgi:glycosyltransferase involved in cell wall biosynthesis
MIPNKKIDDLIRTFAAYQKGFNRESRLLLAGDHNGHERYFARLQELVRELRVDEVVFTGHVEHDELMACYAEADLFLCLSEHEGFGVPLLEAMVFGLPVIAYDAGAVAETLRGGGVLLDDKDPLEVAALVDRVLNDEPLRAAVMRTQARALASLRAVDFGALLLDRLAPVLR